MEINNLPRIKPNEFTYSKSGVYFLFDGDNKLLYIGISKNIRQRIVSHCSPHTQYPRVPFYMIKFVSFIPIKTNSMRGAELYFIKKYSPDFNYPPLYHLCICKQWHRVDFECQVSEEFQKTMVSDIRIDDK